jgi:hypothetical protein
MRKLIFVLLLLAGSVSGQAKVGTTGANFLTIETSVPAIGMGQLGLISPQDCNFATNPALLPFSHHSRFLAGGNPWTNEYVALMKLRTGYASFAFPLATAHSNDGACDTAWRVAGAYRYVGSSLDPIYETTYGGGDSGATFEPRLSIHQIAVGLAHTGVIDFGFGGSVKFGSESFSDHKISSTSFDLGVYGRILIVGGRAGSDEPGETRVRGLVGAAVTNFGPKIKILDRKYDQPRMYRFGLGGEAHIANCRLLLGLQQDHTKFDIVDGTHLGGEVEWHRAIMVRAGQSWFATSSIDVSSIGGSVSLRGLLALVSNGRNSFGFDLVAHYSHMMSDSPIYDGLNAFSLQFKI